MMVLMIHHDYHLNYWRFDRAYFETHNFVGLLMADLMKSGKMHPLLRIGKAILDFQLNFLGHPKIRKMSIFGRIFPPKSCKLGRISAYFLVENLNVDQNLHCLSNFEPVLSEISIFGRHFLSLKYFYIF